jgi:hypothetical protein
VVQTGCYSWRSKHISIVIHGFHQCQRGDCWHIFRQMYLSLMERSEYTVMEKHGQHKLRRDSVEVHEECKSVLIYLMTNRQAKKINNVGIIAWKDHKCKLHFGVLDTRHWRSQGSNS